jgi:chromatin assembly factor 1 subunit A
MAKFFTKPKPVPRAAAVVPSARELSEFEKTFKPFVLKKDAELAPINGFLATKERQGRSSVPNNVIVLDDADDEDVKMIGVKLNTESSLDVSKMSPRGRVNFSQLLRIVLTSQA